MDISAEVTGLYFGAQLVLSGAMSAGDLVTFIGMATQLSSELGDLRPSELKEALDWDLEDAVKVYDLLAFKPRIGLRGGLEPATVAGRRLGPMGAPWAHQGYVRLLV